SQRYYLGGAPRTDNPSPDTGRTSGTARFSPRSGDLAAGARQRIDPSSHPQRAGVSSDHRVPRSPRGGGGGGGPLEARPDGGQEAEGHRRLGRQPAGPGAFGQGGDQGDRHDPPVSPAAPARLSQEWARVQAGRPVTLPAPQPGGRPYPPVRVCQADQGFPRGRRMG